MQLNIRSHSISVRNNGNSTIIYSHISRNEFKYTLCLKTFLVIILLIFIPPTKVNCQKDDIQFSHLTAEDGLSISSVTQILQDTKGFLWFGTYNGLNRYDGYKFKIFLPEPSNPNSISNHFIGSLCEDNKGYVWVATLDGLNRYNPQTEEFRVYKNIPNDPASLSNNNIIYIFKDSEGTIWAGTPNGLNKYNADKDNFTVFFKVNNELNKDNLNSVTCIEEDYMGNLWLGTWNGLTCMKKDGTIIKQYYADSRDSKNFDYRKISYLFEDNSKNLWIALNGKGLDKYGPGTGKFKHYASIQSDNTTLSNNYVSVIYQDKSNNIWIGTKDGLNKYNSQKDNFERIIHNPEKATSIIANEILSIKEDNIGMVWVGTSAGLSRFHQPVNKFSFFRKDDINPLQSLTSNRLNSTYINKKNKMWVGTFEGLDKIDIATGKVVHYKHLTGNANSISDNYVMSVLEDRNGIVWIGTHHSGLNRFDPATGKFKNFKYTFDDSASITNDGVISLCEDHNGTLWAGTWWGLNRYDKKTETFFTYHADPADPHKLSQDLIWTICEDSKGMIWIGTDGGGANMLDPQTGTFTVFSKDTSNSNYISANRVFSLFETQDGIIWLGTSDGLNSYNRETRKTTVYNTKSGLLGNMINGIQEDDNGNLWISTENGLSRFDRKNKTFTNYTKRSGLTDLEFYRNVSAKSGDGTLYFGCRSGLMYFNPKDIKEENLITPVVFTDIKIFNQSVPISINGSSFLTKSITEAKDISIPHYNSVITLEFALMDYFNVRRNQFSYKLVGFDQDWNDVGTRNSATYTNLPPGEYTFNVKGFNSDGVKNPKEASLRIIIVPAYYQTWWFKISFGAGILLIAFFIIQGRLHKIKNQNKLLEQRVAERTRDLDKSILELSQEVVERKKAEEKVQASLNEKELLLKETHHRVKNNLHVISSILFLQSRAVKDKEILTLFEETQNRIRSMALIHEKLYQSKDASQVNLKEYIVGLVKHLSNSFQNEEQKIKTDVHIEDVKLDMDTAISCGLIVNELLTNSHKYAFPKEKLNPNIKNELLIDVKIEKDEKNKFVFTVTDNGIGLPENFNPNETDSLGLKLVNSIVAQLNGSIEISGKNGTEVKIIFNNTNGV